MARKRSDSLAGIGALARRTFPHAHMSDTKWRKLLSALHEAGIDLQQVIVQFVDVAEPRRMRFPTAVNLQVPHPYIDTLEFGPIELRAIAWLEIPALARWPRPGGFPARETKQDLEAVLAVLTTLGRYPVETHADGVRIRGYSR